MGVKKYNLPSLGEFMKDAKPTDLFKRVQEKTLKDIESPEFQEREHKRIAGVARLMHQVVGHEEY